jgi:hypothetical protein
MTDRQYQPVDVQLRPDDLVCSGPGGCGYVVPSEFQEAHEEYHLFSERWVKAQEEEAAQLAEEQAADQRHREKLGRFNPAIEHGGASL